MVNTDAIVSVTANSLSARPLLEKSVFPA